MSDFTDRLAGRYAVESMKASETADDLGERVFGSLVELVDFTSDSLVTTMPDEISAELFEDAIKKQHKWSPNEAKPRWGLALDILNDEKVNLSIGKK